MPGVNIQAKSTRSTTSKVHKAEDVDDEELQTNGFLPIPDVPAAVNIHLGMQYYIPEWDDHVDPNYDFLTCTLTPNRDPYADEVYAHQIYDRPNYDGILVSKVVVDSSKKKRQRVEAVGIHDFILDFGIFTHCCCA